MKPSEQTVGVWIKLADEVLHRAFPLDSRAIRHATRIAFNVDDRLKPIAFLHDIPEDTHITIEDLIKLGFPSYIIDAVRLLTHLKGVSNMDYWTAIKTSPDALEVKRKDINDNLNDQPSDHARQKYAIALKFFDEP
jgi:hypothetical protein